LIKISFRLIIVGFKSVRSVLNMSYVSLVVDHISFDSYYSSENGLGRSGILIKITVP